MTQMNPSIGVLHNLLEKSEHMLPISENVDQDIIAQENVANFHQAIPKGNGNFKGSNGHKISFYKKHWN